LLFQGVCLFAGDDKYAPLPDQIVKASTVFLINESGEPKLGDAVYRQIKSWNKWQITTDKTQANLVLTINSKTRTLAPGPYYLSISDAKSGEQLWTSGTSMQGKLWRTWNAIAKDLVADIRNRMN
jgi:hypothetical protein